MYNYSPGIFFQSYFKTIKGIVYLCESMNLREELLNYYINNKNSKEIIKLCEKYGDTETNLWV